MSVVVIVACVHIDTRNKRLRNLPIVQGVEIKTRDAAYIDANGGKIEQIQSRYGTMPASGDEIERGQLPSGNESMSRTSRICQAQTLDTTVCWLSSCLAFLRW